MPIWHFDINLIPKEGLKGIHGFVPDELPEYTVMTLETNLDEIPLHNYWQGVDVLREVLPDAEVILSESFHRSKTEVKLGTRDGNRITISPEEVLFRFDLREPDLEVLESVLRLARKYDCMLVVDKNGKVIAPEMLPVLEQVVCSTAYAFIKDPQATLRRLGTEKESEGNEPHWHTHQS